MDTTTVAGEDSIVISVSDPAESAGRANMLGKCMRKAIQAPAKKNGESHVSKKIPVWQLARAVQVTTNAIVMPGNGVWHRWESIKNSKNTLNCQKKAKIDQLQLVF